MNNLSPGPAGTSLKLSTCLKAFPSVEYVILYLSLILLSPMNVCVELQYLTTLHQSLSRMVMLAWGVSP